MNIPYAKFNEKNSLPIRPGIFARNLALQRKLAGKISTYLECLCYGNPEEFNALTQEDYSMQIGKKTYFYSSRLILLSDAITQGVEDFLKISGSLDTL